MFQEFYAQYMNQPCEQFSKELYALAEEYHIRTERFDRIVCHGSFRHGSVMPANGRELSIINQYAHRVRREIERRALRKGLDIKSLHEAVRLLSVHDHTWLQKV